jgi:hypothetical protein
MTRPLMTLRSRFLTSDDQFVASCQTRGCANPAWINSYCVDCSEELIALADWQKQRQNSSRSRYSRAIKAAISLLTRLGLV